jgi:hypothetical protein
MAMPTCLSSVHRYAAGKEVAAFETVFCLYPMIWELRFSMISFSRLSESSVWRRGKKERRVSLDVRSQVARLLSSYDTSCQYGAGKNAR